MKWKPFLAGATRARWHFRLNWWASLSRRGACLRRQVLHDGPLRPLTASRRASSHRMVHA